jgi:protein-serine/threonine kinase
VTPSHDYLSAGIPSDLNTSTQRSFSSSSHQQQQNHHQNSQQQINGSGSKDKKWKQMFRFGSIGRKTSSGQVPTNGMTSAKEPGSPSSLIDRTENGSNATGTPQQGNSQSPIAGNQTFFGTPPVLPPTTSFRPIMGSTVVADPASFSNDSMSSDGGATRSSQMEHMTSASGSMSKGDETRQSSPLTHMHLQPAVEVVQDSNGVQTIKLPLSSSTASNTSGTETGGGFASKLLRRVSSAPDYNKLIANNPMNSNGNSGQNNYLSPSGQSSDMPSTPGTDAEPDAIYFPGSPIRMDSNARSFSSKDFEKARNPSGKSPHNTPKTKGGLSFPGSKKSASAKATTTDPRSQMLAMPSSAGAMASLQGSADASPSGVPRTQFRRTYSSNSIKVREVEVGPNSFSKVKMLGKGDVGKVYLVREKKTEKLFAMKGEYISHPVLPSF